MTAPTVLNSGAIGFASSTTHNVPIPSAPGPSAGDLILIFFGTIADPTFTTPTGFSVVAARVANGTATAHAVYGKISDGSEGGTNVNVATGTAAVAGAVVVIVTGKTFSLASDVAAGTIATGTSTSINPPSASWAWGAEDNISFTGQVFTKNAGSGNSPSGYSFLEDGNTGSGSSGIRMRVDTATHLADASPEDPAAASVIASVGWCASTIVVLGVTSVAHTMAATFAGAGAQSGVLTRGARPVASLAGVGAVAPKLTRGVRPVASLASVGALAPKLTRGVTLASALAGVGAMTPALTRAPGGIAASLAGVVAMSPAMTRGTYLAAGLAGVGVMSPALAGQFVLASSLTSIGATSPMLTRGALLALSASGAGALTAALLRRAALSATLAGVGTLSPALHRQAAFRATLAGVGAISPKLTRGVYIRSSLTGVGVLHGALTQVVIVRVVSRQRPRVYVHDGATLERIAQLTHVKDINRSFALREHVRQAQITLLRSDPAYLDTSTRYGNVLVIESTEYPLPWVGRITDRQRAEDGKAVTVLADSYDAILAERHLPFDFETRTAGTTEAFRRILATINGQNATGIGLGYVEADDVSPLSLPDVFGADALDQLAKVANMEWWLTHSIIRGTLRVYANMIRERGADYSSSVTLSGPGGNFELVDWRESNRAAVYRQTVIGGQSELLEAWSERERGSAVRDGSSPRTDIAEIVAEGARVLRFGHIIASDTSFAAPTTRREKRDVIEALKAEGGPTLASKALLDRRDSPGGVILGRVYPDDIETWHALEPGNVIWLEHPEPFDEGYSGVAAVTSAQPMESDRFVEVTLEVS